MGPCKCKNNSYGYKRCKRLFIFRWCCYCTRLSRCIKIRDITSIGRGGSDATAVAVAKIFNTDTCEIYTDVDGVYSSDPNKIPLAKDR